MLQLLIFHLFVNFFNPILAFSNVSLVIETAGGLISQFGAKHDRDIIANQLANMESNSSSVCINNSVLLSNNDWFSINCNASQLVVIQGYNATPLNCNITVRVNQPMLISLTLDLPTVATLKSDYWIRIPSGTKHFPLNLMIYPNRMGLSYLKIWIRKAKSCFLFRDCEKVQFYPGKYKNASFVHEYTRNLINQTEFNETSAILGLSLKVLRTQGVKDLIFRIVVAALLIAITFVMGCELNIFLILKHLRNPVGPLIGFLCQFGLMPIVSLVISISFPISKEFGFGLLVIGCCPGGGGSNIWCLLLGGDINLSMTMTFISNTAALGMMPLLLFIYGRVFIDVNKIQIPYLQIAGQLLYVVIPVTAGILLNWKRPKISAMFKKALQPMAFTFILVLITFGIYVNLPIYGLIGSYVLIFPISALLPWIGFILAGGIAVLCRRPKAEVLTISIETGIQNIGVAILVLLYSMPQPSGDIGAVMPLIVSMCTPLPLIITYAFKFFINNRCYRKTSHKQLSQSDHLDANLPDV